MCGVPSSHGAEKLHVTRGLFGGVAHWRALCDGRPEALHFFNKGFFITHMDVAAVQLISICLLDG